MDAKDRPASPAGRSAPLGTSLVPRGWHYLSPRICDKFKLEQWSSTAKHLPAAPLCLPALTGQAGQAGAKHAKELPDGQAQVGQDHSHRGVAD